MEIVNLEGPMQDRVKLDEEELLIVKRALKSKLFERSGGTFEERLPKFQKMLSELSEKFNIPEPKIVAPEQLRQANIPGFQYEPGENIIVVGRLSLVSILDGFATALQFRQENGEVNGSFVIAFGLSAFKQAAPNMFETARSAGRLMYTDVAYTDGGRIQPQTGAPAGIDEPDDIEGLDTRNEHGDADRGNGPGED
jgi:hypothetical protein